MSHAFDPSRAAVLAVDLQNDYLPEGNWPVAGYDQVLAKAAQVMAAARAAEVPVVHIQMWKDPARGMGPPSQEVVDRPEWLGGMAGSWGAELSAPVAAAPGETVLRKTFASGFRDTELDRRLRDLGIGDVMVAGVWTDICVRGTVLDAVDLGYRVWLVKDACGSGTRDMHETAVVDMANRLYGGWISGAEEAVKALAGAPAEPWRFTRPVAFAFTRDDLSAHYAAL